MYIIKLSSDVLIHEIIEKSPTNFSIKCADPISADKLEQALKTLFENDIEISTANYVLPEVKIVRIFVTLPEPDQIIEMIKSYNSFLVNAEINFVRSYQIKTLAGVYTNLILSCSLQTQKLILQRGNLLIGLSQCRVFENINTLQCLQCYAYGHFARNRASAIICKNCTESHSHRECISPILKCINCVRENVKLAKNKCNLLNTNHRANDERCKCRIARIDGLKHYFVKK